MSKEKNNRESMIFYRSFFEAIEDIPEQNQLEVYRAIFHFSFNFKEIELTGLSRTIFKLVKPQLDANIKKWENGCKGADHGSKGGRPSTPKEPQANPSADIEIKPQKNPKLTPNVNDNVECIMNNENNNNNEKDIITSVPQDFLSLTPDELKSIKSTLIKRDGRSYPVTTPEIITKQDWCFLKGIMKQEFSRSDNIDILTYVLRRSYPVDYSKRSCIMTDRQVKETIEQIAEMMQIGCFKKSVDKAISESYKQLYPATTTHNAQSQKNDDWKRTNNKTYGGKL